MADRVAFIHGDAPVVREKRSSEPERYAACTREHLGWGAVTLMRR